MIRRRFHWMLLALAAVFVFAAPLTAADFTFYVGGVVPGSVEYKGFDTMLDSSPVYGIRLAKSFVPFFGMEHSLAFSSDYLFPRSVAEIKDAKGFTYNSNLIINIPLPLKKVVPYFTAGAGLIHQYGDNDMPVGTKFAFNYGGGLKFPRLVGPLGVRFDMRGYRTTGIFSRSLNLFEASGGVLLSIGN